MTNPRTTLPALVNVDPADDNDHLTTLFDPRITVMPRCPHCNTTAKNACVWEASRESDSIRPRGCLVSAQLGPNDELPF